VCGRRLKVPRARLVAAEDEREHALRRVLAERVAEPGSPRGAEEVRTLDVERVDNRDSIANTRQQRVRARLPRLVASALTAMIPEDQAELAAQRSSEARRLRDLQRIREAGVEQDGRASASRVLEVRTDAVAGVRRVRQAPSFLAASTSIRREGRLDEPTRPSPRCSQPDSMKRPERSVDYDLDA
jgi:hypothetical protein